MMHKTLMIWLVATMVATGAWAQRVTFKFQDGLNDKPAMRKNMESSITTLLTEINTAYVQGRSLQLDGLKMTPHARQSLIDLWTLYAPFSCDNSENVSRCLSCVTGYEVREILITFHPADATAFHGSLERELTISFTADETITSVVPAMEDHSLSVFLNQADGVIDARRRMEILKFVEDFRSYYDNKDLQAIDDVFSDDALIVTGKVVMRQNLGRDQAALRPDIVYKKQTKKEYVASLKKVFSANKYIKVKFDDITLTPHPYKDNYYGVTLHQNWKSSGYEDDGYVFLLWQFFDDPDKHPIVHVRTWQPEKMGNTTLKPEDIFGTKDFIIR